MKLSENLEKQRNSEGKEQLDSYELFLLASEKASSIWQQAEDSRLTYESEANEIASLCNELSSAKEKLKNVNWSLVSDEKTSEVLDTLKGFTEHVESRIQRLKESFHDICCLMEESMKLMIPYLDSDNRQSKIAEMLLLTRPDWYKLFLQKNKCDYGFEHVVPPFVIQLDQRLNEESKTESQQGNRLSTINEQEAPTQVVNPDWNHDFDF